MFKIDFEIMLREYRLRFGVCSLSVWSFSFDARDGGRIVI